MMKEFDFKSIKGLEESQYFNQLDTFEARQTVAGFYDRWIFDFNRIIDASKGTGNTRIPVLFNLNPVVTTSGIGASTDEATPNQPLVVLRNKNGNETFELYPELPKTKKVDGITDTNVFNEDALLYLVPEPTTFSTRSGYFEITLKTDKQNCFVLAGMSEGTSPAIKRFLGNSQEDPAYVDNNSMYVSEHNATLANIKFNIVNGKAQLFYEDLYGENKKEFTINGLTNIADNEWHHIVVNFGQTGTIREHGKKFNKRFIEIWVDGQLDKRTYEYINDEQMYFPFINYFLVDPELAKVIDGIEDNGWETYDESTLFGQPFVGQNEFEYIVVNGIWNDLATPSAFRGSIDTFTMGMNVALSKFNIQQRYRLWNGREKAATKSFTALAEIVNPNIVTNSKKALKLYWNNFFDTESKNGIELDKNFSVESYSVTHRTINSSTEVNNVDLANGKNLNFLKDVRIALTDNVVLWGPGKDYIMNNAHTSDVTFSTARQYDPRNLAGIDELVAIFQDDGTVNPTFNDFWTNKSIMNIAFSGVTLVNGDRILLTNQFNKRDNGIYIFNGLSAPLTRAEDSLSSSQLNNGVVRIVDGKYKDTSWMLSKNIDSLLDDQEWVQLEYHPSSDTINSQPFYSTRWSTENGIERFIDLEQDLDISKYDVVVFMNYPETNEEIKQNFVQYNDFEISVLYKNFIQSLKNVAAQGANIYVSSPKLAEDMGIVKNFTKVTQALENADAQSAANSPFEQNEPAERYFHTHRNLNYNLATEVSGLTNRETYLLTDFINYNPDNNYDYEQYHAKYSYRQLGILEGNEFIIPGLSLRSITLNENLPGFNANQRGTKDLFAVAPSDILAGTVVTKFGNSYLESGEVVNNPYDDYATTIIVHNEQLLDGQPISGKIFVNCVEDGYTFSREEYNKATIQVLPTEDPNETVATRNWQYSTSRLNRAPQRINVRELTNFGQTTPTNGGGGAFIQGATNSSNGIIRSESDKGNIDYQSDLYPTEDEEIYPLQEIPVLSMTWLGLQWLAE